MGSSRGAGGVKSNDIIIIMIMIMIIISSSSSSISIIVVVVVIVVDHGRIFILHSCIRKY